jgi:hypothetical protein
MSQEAIIALLFIIVQAAFWLWVKTSIAKMDKTANDLTDFKLLVSDKYVKQTQLNEHLDRIDKSLDEIKKMITAMLTNKGLDV